MTSSTLAVAMGRAIREARKAAGLTQEQLAEKIGSSSNWLSGLERGVGQPSLHLLTQIAEATGTSAEAILQASLVSPNRPEEGELSMLISRLSDRDLRILLATARAAAKEPEDR